MGKIKAKRKSIVEARVKGGYTATDIANFIGLTKQAIYNIENGANSPSPKTAKAMCDVLGKEFDDLFEIVTEGE